MLEIDWKTIDSVEKADLLIKALTSYRNDWLQKIESVPMLSDELAKADDQVLQTEIAIEKAVSRKTALECRNKWLPYLDKPVWFKCEEDKGVRNEYLGYVKEIESLETLVSTCCTGVQITFKNLLNVVATSEGSRYTIQSTLTMFVRKENPMAEVDSDGEEIYKRFCTLITTTLSSLLFKI